MQSTRFAKNEISVERIYSAISRRILDIPDVWAWYSPTPKVRAKLAQLESYSNLHDRRRCFIIGNGPSISKMDLSPLENEFTFGLNRIYLAFDRFSFRPTYYVCMNELVLDQFAEEISELGMPKFLNWNRRHHFSFDDASTNFVRLTLSINDSFTTSFQRPLFGGGTVTYVALQIAYIMGFSEVILIGVDHSFADQGIPNKVETRQAETDRNHFHPNYFPKGVKWQLPDLRRSELAYELARQAFEQDGRKILDATVNGKCPVFERVDFHSLF